MVASWQRQARLNLSFSDPTNGTMMEFSQWLAKDTSTTNLKLSFSQLRGEQARCLGNGLRENAVLRDLCLMGCDIRATSAQHLSEALQRNHVLLSLDLSHNLLGPNGAQHLAAALGQKTSSIQRLDLRSNRIGERGAEFLGDALRDNTALLSLRLHGNLIGDEGAAAFADALRQNATLLDLGLSCNCINDAGAWRLADALRPNLTLECLDLRRNKIGDAGARQLVTVMEEAGVPALLWLGRNPVIGSSKRKRPRLLLGGEDDASQATLEHELSPDDIHARHCKCALDVKGCAFCAQLDLSEHTSACDGRLPCASPAMRCNVMDLPQSTWTLTKGCRRAATANGPAWRGLSAGGGRSCRGQTRPKSASSFRSSVPSSPQLLVTSAAAGISLAAEDANSGKPTQSTSARTRASAGAAPLPRSSQHAKADLWFNNPELLRGTRRRPRSAMGPRVASYADQPAALRF